MKLIIIYKTSAHNFKDRENQIEDISVCLTCARQVPDHEFISSVGYPEEELPVDNCAICNIPFNLFT